MFNFKGQKNSIVFCDTSALTQSIQLVRTDWKLIKIKMKKIHPNLKPFSKQNILTSFPFTIFVDIEAAKMLPNAKNKQIHCTSIL